MSRIKVMNFVARLRREICGDPNKVNNIPMSENLIGYHMGITSHEAVVVMLEAVRYGICRKVNEMFVV